MTPLCIELFAGSFGWSAGWLGIGGRAVGFDIEHLPHHGPVPEGAELVIQDVLTLHGSQFKDAALILASPPCQQYSYRAMPWKRAKALPPPDNSLFEACFRIQREASEAAGHHIPMVVENVRGAQKWVGRAPWNYGSFYLWGDVPALMPALMPIRMGRVTKNSGGSWFGVRDGMRLDRNDPRDMRRNEKGEWVNAEATGGWNHPGKAMDGIKQPGSGAIWFDTGIAKHGSRSAARKAASALIAKIPFPLADWIARCFWPAESERAA